MNQSLISVIVPVYKVEQYLDECIQSIINQTYKNLEIILVDDGSPDRCPEMCDEYAKQDSRVKVIHQKNAGVSAARNAGIDVARGEYIGFVDSDDLIAPDMYDKLYRGFGENETKLFAVKCKNKRILNGVLVPSDLGRYSNDTVINSEDFLLNLVTGYFFCSVCDMLIKKQYLSQRFEEGKTGEDFRLLYHLGYDVERNNLSMRLIPEELYFYRKTEESAVTSVAYYICEIESALYMYNDAKQKGKKQVADNLYLKYAASLMRFIFIMTKEPLWKEKYFLKFQIKLFGLNWGILRKHWSIRYRIGVFIAAVFPPLMFVRGIYKFVTKQGECPPWYFLERQ